MHACCSFTKYVYIASVQSTLKHQVKEIVEQVCVCVCVYTSKTLLDGYLAS